jgi:hypothetical protein
MPADDRAIEVDGLAFEISPAGVDALLRGEGIAVRLSSLNIHVTEAALNAILARLAPEGQPGAMQAKLSPEGVAIDRRDGNKNLHLDVAVTNLHLRLADGELHLESGGS